MIKKRCQNLRPIQLLSSHTESRSLSNVKTYLKLLMSTNKNEMAF